ncbi:MAG TPA: GIY-YIG nuclease family protein [Patescibacteria group bacterium]|nr:GIY-YIG nuclease family protein [Patescibacteria group bacterium]
MKNHGWIYASFDDKILHTEATFRDSPPAGGQEAVNNNMWFVYALYNHTRQKIYIGQTGNLEQRIAEHNKKRGNHFTSKIDGEWVIIYKEEVKSRREAW